MQESNTAETITPAAVAPVVATDNDKTLRLVAYILNLISTICIGWTLIPLAWMIPMTIISYGIYKGTKKNTVAFGVCTLLFVNLISGILLLVAKKDD
jgi:hypothetical protein